MNIKFANSVPEDWRLHLLSFHELTKALNEAFEAGDEPKMLSLHSELRTRISESIYHDNGIAS